MKIEKHWHNLNENETNDEIFISLINSIKNLDFKIYQGCSRSFRILFQERLSSLGWSDKVEIDADTKISITSINKSSGLCLQTGNMSRFYADILKLEYLFKKGKIQRAFYILPSKPAAQLIGSNIANFERLSHELTMFKNVITIPVLVIGIR